MQSYLLVLEIHPIEIGATYDMLPVHCTLVHWFKIRKGLEGKLSTELRLITSTRKPVILTAENEETFTGMTKDGPIPVTVNTVTYIPDLRALHEAICDVLDDLGAEYSSPAYVRDTYVPHVTHQTTGSLAMGTSHTSEAVYLIGADAPAYGNTRQAVARFSFKPS